MDKYEYKVRADEIRALIAEGEYVEAVKIADTIDWRRVRSIMMLCTISDLYKINRRFQESKDILLLAYEKHPTGRLIVYSLCELSIKLEEYVQAIEYYKEFVQIAPKDTGRYVLQYRLYEAQDVSLEERIAVLEEFKKRDYREKWAYELAYLYHRIGLSTKCVEECDEMFLWFGEGKYVVKALELKALHEPLNEDQQAKYTAWTSEPGEQEEISEEEQLYAADYESDISVDTQVAGKVKHTQEDDDDGPDLSAPLVPTMELPEVKTIDMGQYNTINLQMALAESMKEILEDEQNQAQEEVQKSSWHRNGMTEERAAQPTKIPAVAQADWQSDEMAEIQTAEFPSEPSQWQEESMEWPEEEEWVTDELSEIRTEGAAEPQVPEQTGWLSDELAQESEGEGTDTFAQEYAQEAENAEAVQDDDKVYTQQEIFVEDNSGDELFAEDVPGQADVQNIERTTAEEGMQEILALEEPMQEEEESIGEERTVTESLIAPLLEETIRLPDPRKVEERLRQTQVVNFPKKVEPVKNDAPKVVEPEPDKVVPSQVKKPSAEREGLLDAGVKQAVPKTVQTDRVDRIPGARTGVLTPLNAKPSKFDRILSQEYDGQISLVVPDAESIEKQITGQLSIEDIMAEWEQMKKSNEQKRMEEVRQRILEHTGNLFADFDEATKNGLLEELEKAFVAAIMKESGQKPKIKKVILPEDLPERKPELAERLSAVSDEIVGELIESGIGDELEETEGFEESAVDDEEAYEPELEDEEVQEEPQEPETTGEHQDAVSGSVDDRELTEDELELFGQFTHHRKSKRQLVHTLDNMSLASYTGNVIVTGEEESAALTLAKALIKEMQYNDSNFSGKVAKISSLVLNKKDVAETFARLDNGALIIEKAGKLKPPVVSKMVKVLEKDNMGLLVIILDKKQDMTQLFAQNPVLNNNFNLRVDIEPLDDEALVAYAKQYAEEMEYSIDEFGILALHTRIADRQTSDHEVSMAEVRELVDEAISYANKKTPKHFMDILLAKRYDDEDMIILREKDFMHY